MKSQVDEVLAGWFTRWVVRARLRPYPVIAVSLVTTVILGVYAAFNLGINSDNVRLISERLPSRQNHEAFAKLFPNLENALLIVVDGDTPELARRGAISLMERIQSDPERFTTAYMPGGGTFFETNGLLYRSAEELDHFGDQMAAVQPILAALEQDASVANFARLVSQGLERAREGEEGATLGSQEWAQILDSVSHATLTVYSEFPLALSWEQMLLSGSAVEVSKRRVIVVHPVLDFTSILAAKAPMEEIRRFSRELGLVPDQGIRVRITGNPALNYEEMIGLAWDLGGGGVLCFFLVVGILNRALRSLKVVIAEVATLLIGLVWTAGFAAFTVGHLSLVSAAFAVLFIGLGVDFGIHLGMAFMAALREGASLEDALDHAASSVGSSLVICTITTAIGFYVFIPTDYLGVAELGMIAGTGMFIILALTATLFPALLVTWLRIEPEGLGAGSLAFRSTWWRVFDEHPRLVAGIAFVCLLGGLVLVPRAHFDPNVIEMRDPTTESVQAFDDLLADSGAMSPWFVDSIAPDLEAAEATAKRMGELDSVEMTLTLADYVPKNQEEKLEVLSDIAFLLETPPGSSPPAPEEELTLAEQIDAIRALHDVLSQPWVTEDDSTLGASMRLLRDTLADFLDEVERDENPRHAISVLEEVLLSGLPAQIERLRAAVNTTGVTMDGLPEELVERMRAPDGQTRVQIYPQHDLSDFVELTRFADEVRTVDPNATGISINLIEFGRAVKSSFRQALISAISIITVLLLFLWRRLTPTLLVISPLFLSSVSTVACMVIADIPFNFANVVVIPLLLGIGVDSGIHLVHRATHLAGEPSDLMDSTTARAVFYSAVTTTISFGTLALSSHRGVASLGIMLTVGMTLTVVCNLVVLPAMLRISRYGEVGDARRGG